ncbi:MAG TPA: AAC(3) family N-acetyltransferase [Bacillales bacterium]|nr:AAC(3) family N-acetyltransferase [Bacillales bacterium]
MSEEKAISGADAPRTRKSLARDLRALGLSPGMTLLAHTSLSSLGWVCGGPVAVIQALQDVLTPDGTLIMPAHSANLSDPAEWENPPIPQSWWAPVREEMPAFDPAITPTFFIGAIAEAFRTFPDVLRSNHPVHSFAAWGKHAEFVTANHSLDDGLGDASPLGAVYRLGGHVLMLGTNYDSNTSMHLAEHHSGAAAPVTKRSPIFENGRKVWKSYGELDYDEDRFPAIGAAFEQAHTVRAGRVGSADAKLVEQRALVDFAAAWLRNNGTQ